MSWGIKIALLYLGFVTLILTLVFTCFANKTELEYKDYYARELRFQDQIDAATNAGNLETPIDYQLNNDYVRIMIPKELLEKEFKGTITFLRPSDSSKDQTLGLAPDGSGEQIINTLAFAKGVYKMQIAFNSGGKEYYKENIITLK